jgi:hypothetical protein
MNLLLIFFANEILIYYRGCQTFNFVTLSKGLLATFIFCPAIWLRDMNKQADLVLFEFASRFTYLQAPNRAFVFFYDMYVFGEWGKPRKEAWIRIACLWSEIWTWDLPRRKVIPFFTQFGRALRKRKMEILSSDIFLPTSQLCPKHPLIKLCCLSSQFVKI